jgi:tetratricopeptide (TPR) repeat protein
MLPAVLLILDVYPLRRTSRFNRPHCVAVMLDKVPLAIMAAIVLGLTVWARHQSTAAFTRPATLEEFGIVERLAQAAYLWLYYGWRALWPVHLSPIYTTLIDFAPLEWPFLASMVSVPLITTALIAMRRRWPGALALWLAHVVILVPVLGWTEHPHYPSDRYALLANITWAVAAAGALWSLRARRRGFLFAVAAGLIVVASLAVMSWRQTAIWRDSESLFTHAAEMLDGHRMQSDMLVRLGLTRAMEGQWLLAAHDFARAARANPAYALPQLRLGEYLAAHGLMQAASDEWQRLLAAHPDDDAVRRAAAFVLYGGEQPDAAILILTNGLKRNPGSLDLRFSLGVILSATGRPAEGMREFRTILELDPDHTGAAWAIERLQSR